jgi:hypothetical protein
MNYKRIYEHLVERGQERSIIEGYKEVHHIIPKCMGGNNSIDNLVALTPEEHYVAHQLLVKIYPNNMNLWKAVKLMTGGNNNQDRSKNKMYGWLKRKIFYKDSRITKTCKLCNKPFKSYERAKRVYCGVGCRQVGKKEHTCNICNKTFLAFECSKRKFCSPICKKLSQENKITLCCKYCQKDFKVVLGKAKRRQYCSPKCSSESQQKRLIKNCEYCNALIIGQPNVVLTRKFCSKKCTDNSRKK